MATKTNKQSANYMSVNLNDSEPFFLLFPEVHWKVMFILYREYKVHEDTITIDKDLIDAIVKELGCSELQVRVSVTKLLKKGVLLRAKRGKYQLAKTPFQKGTKGFVNETINEEDDNGAMGHHL